MIGREEENWYELYAGLCESKEQPAASMLRTSIFYGPTYA